jgi:hypothetical protein
MSELAVVMASTPNHAYDEAFLDYRGVEGGLQNFKEFKKAFVKVPASGFMKSMWPELKAVYILAKQ